jgi:hypothetical protein
MWGERMTSYEYPYTFTEAMSRVSQTVKVTSCYTDTYSQYPASGIYHLDDTFRLKDDKGSTPYILDDEIDSMWRTIK